MTNILQKILFKHVLEYLNSICRLKHLIHFQMIDKWLFRQISGESVVIAASHPWLQADKWGILGS